MDDIIDQIAQHLAERRNDYGADEQLHVALTFQGEFPTAYSWVSDGTTAQTEDDQANDELIELIRTQIIARGLDLEVFIATAHPEGGISVHAGW